MKKSEKIEIRVSIAEKRALSQLASDEGRSVSQLVRDVVKKYTVLNMANPRARFSRSKMAALISVGFLFGTVLPLAVLHLDHSENYMVHGVVNTNGFGFPLSGKSIHQSKTIGPNTDGMRFDFKLGENAGGERVVNVSICQTQLSNCEIVAQAELSLSDNSPSVWQTAGANAENIFLVIQPVES